MTPEQKAKAYDEALKAAVVAHKDEDKHIRATLERIFPELKESENERIRKGMLQGFKDYGEPEYVWWEGVKVKECIAWLERLGESNPYSGVSFEYDGHIWGMCARDNGVDILCDKRIIEHLEKQGEQNYEFHGIAESRPAKGELNKLCQELSQSKVTKISDQEWSEEDEELLNSIIKEIESELKKPYFKGYDLICNKKISWLKSLKNRIQSKQNA